MCYRWLSVLAVFAVSMAALGQQAPAPQPQAVQLDPATNKLDSLLVNWEKAMSSINSLYTVVNRSSTDKVLLSVDTFEGEARFLKPNKASLYLKNVKKSDDFEYLILNGQNAYRFDPSNKEIQVYSLPPAKQGQVSDENFASMLFGMKAAEAKRRYDLQFTKEDQYYYYIQVLPRDNRDKADFSRARLVLTKTTNMPRQIWFEMPNGNETTWEFTKMQPNVTLRSSDFDQPTPPANWKIKKVATPEQGPR
jgi:TIGR03009 family protein